MGFLLVWVLLPLVQTVPEDFSFPGRLCEHRADQSTIVSSTRDKETSIATRHYSSFNFLLTPSSTGNTVPLKAAMVSPYGDLIRGSQLSEKRSSVSIGLRSSTRPPKMVSIVDELV